MGEAVIHDQRQMCGPVVHHTPDEVRAYWALHGDRRVERGHERFPTAPRRRELTHVKARLEATVNNGRWVAQCPGGPIGQCNGGIACWPDHEHACCLDCGSIYPVDFPKANRIEEAEAVLALRPMEARNWDPARESIDDLKAENLRHGYAPSQGEIDWRHAISQEHGIPVALVDEIVASSKRKRHK